MGGPRVREGIKLFNDAGIPTYTSPEKGVRAFMYLVSYSRNRDVLYETPREIPVEFPLDRGKLRAVFDTILSEGHDVLTESTSKALLEAYEIPVAKAYVARREDDAVELAQRIGFPVAMKVFLSGHHAQDGCRRRRTQSGQRRRSPGSFRADRDRGQGTSGPMPR